MDDIVIFADNNWLTVLNPDFSVKEKQNFAIDGGIAYVATSKKTKKIAYVKACNAEQIVTSQNLGGDTHFEYKAKRQSLHGIAFDLQDIFV